VKEVLLVSEAISTPFDEGLKNIIFHIMKCLSQKDKTVFVTKTRNITTGLDVQKIGLNKLFFNMGLRQLLKKYSPQIILYIPEASHTLNSFVRAKMLKLLCKRAQVAMLGVQPRKCHIFLRVFLKFLRPDLLFLLGRSNKDFFEQKGLRIKVLPPAVDQKRFYKVEGRNKLLLRRKYSFPVEKTIVSHIGHIKSSRNLECLLDVQKMDNTQVIIVGSSSTKTDRQLKDLLENHGIIIINDFIPEIQEIYQLSDIYVFPVVDNQAAIEVPLSVLEAVACGIPVATTCFGALTNYFREDRGFRYFATGEELVKLVEKMRNINTHNEEKMKCFSWDRFVGEIMDSFNKEEREIDYRELHKPYKKAIDYEHKLYANNSYDSSMWEIEKQILVQEITLFEKDKTKYLDFACGTGRILAFMEQFVSESTGVDVSENMLYLAKKKARKSFLLNSDLTQHDVIADKQYNLITAFRFFLNAEDDLRKKVMFLLSEKLADRGTLIFNLHGNTFSYYLFPIIFKKFKPNQEKLNHVSFFRISKLLKETRLKIKRIYGIGFVPSSFYRLFKSQKKLFIWIDKTFSTCPLMKYFARNLIFICGRDRR
jgi:glycosyltransferase involved in cell wall biosynthesis